MRDPVLDEPAEQEKQEEHASDRDGRFEPKLTSRHPKFATLDRSTRFPFVRTTISTAGEAGCGGLRVGRAPVRMDMR